MSQPSRPRTCGPALRHRRDLWIETIQELENRRLLAPFLPLAPDVVTFTPTMPTPTNPNLGSVTISQGSSGGTDPNFLTAAPVTSVSELTSNSMSFGGDIVRIKAGPGGDFGKGIYAITRGAGGNPRVVNNPGVIYRVDPATGKASKFFDLNTVINQMKPGGDASNDFNSDSTGLKNWYDIAFDPEGYFNGKPSMFVASVDQSDPNKNAVYQIDSKGSLIGVFFVKETFSQNEMLIHPTSIMVPPPEDQSFLRGLFAGSGGQAPPSSDPATDFVALFFDANAYSPGQVLSNANFQFASPFKAPPGVKPTALDFGPQVGLTASNPDYVPSSRGAARAKDFAGARRYVEWLQGLGGGDEYPGIGLKSRITAKIWTKKGVRVRLGLGLMERRSYRDNVGLAIGAPLR